MPLATYTGQEPVSTSAPGLDLEARILAGAAFLAGFGIVFTVSLVGQLPYSELVLLPLALYVLFTAVRHRGWPHALMQGRTFKRLLWAAAVSFAGYVMSDLYRSTPLHDLARGWARWAFLAVDLIAMVYLFARDWSNVRRFVIGFCAGVVVSVLTVGPQFDDYWKFGFAYPLSFALPMLVPSQRRLLLSILFCCLGVVHVFMGARSLGGTCLLAGAAIWLATLSNRKRWIALSISVPLALGLLAYAYLRSGVGERAEGSTTERTAMLQYAGLTFLQSPLIGQGSWFTKTARADEFFARRAELRGGVDAVSLEEAGEIAIHSQVLVALAEGGIFGGVFFLCLGGLFAWGLWFSATNDFTLRPLVLILLLNGAWDLAMSTFSGSERVLIASSCALLVALRAAGKAR